jgi:hypothetical protein
MKKLIFSLLITMICSITAHDEKHFKTVQHNPQTNQLSWAKKIACEQLARNRKTEHDYHVQAPWLNNKQLDINMSQLVHIVGALWSVKCVKSAATLKWTPFMETIDVPYIDGLEYNEYNVSTFLFFTYRFFAGQQKWPFKIVDQQENIDQK